MEFNNKLNILCESLLNGSQLIQFQNITKLYGLVKELNIYSGNNEAKFISKLIEIISKLECKNINVLILDLLVDCCKKKLIDCDLTINNLISSINSNSSNLAIILRGITRLILLQQNKSYSLRNPTHPFIIILRNVDQTSDHLNTLICQEIKFIYENNSTVNDLVILKSFYLHIFLDKFNIKHKIVEILIEKQRISENTSELQLIKLYLDHLNETEIKSVEFLIVLNKLISFLDNKHEPNYNLEEFIYRIISIMCFVDKNHFINCNYLWQNLKKSIDGNETIRKNMTNGRILNLLAGSLYQASFSNFEKYIELTLVCIDSYGGKDKLNLAVFYPPIFNYLTCFGANESQFKKYHDSILNLLRAVDRKIKKINNFETANEQVSTSLSFYLQEDYLNIEKFNSLAAYFLMNDSENNLNNVQLLIDVVQKWPTMSVTVIALFLFKIKISQNQNMLCEVLGHLSSLAVNKNDVNLFVKIFISIIDSALARNKTEYNFNFVQIACFKQLTKLFQSPLYEKLVYPYLSKYVLTRSNLNMDMNSLYIKAYCIHQVITYRPDYYTPQLLSTISEFLNNYSSLESSGPSALLIDTLGYLCRSEIIEMKSTWNAISSKYKDEKRTLVLMAFCRFMAISSELKFDLYQSLIEELVKNLWLLIRSKNDDVVSAAYESLSSFDSSLFKCHHLSLNILESLKERQKHILNLKENEEKTLDEIFHKIPSSCYIDLFNNLSCNAFKGFSKFITKLLKNELDLMPKRVFYFNTEKQKTFEEQTEFHEKIFGNFSSYLSEEIKTVIRDLQVSKEVNIEFLLFGFDVSIEKDSSGKQTKRQKMIHWRNYEQILTLILSKGKFVFNEKNFMIKLKGWKKFIEKAYDACIQSIHVETQMQIDENPSMSQIELQSLKDRLKNASISARNKIALIISTSLCINSETNTHMYDTAILAYIGLINASSNYTRPLEDKSMLKEHSQWLDGLIDLALNVHEMQKVTKQLKNQSAFPHDLITFLKDTFKNTQMFELFLAEINAYCTAFRISSYLRDFIRKIQLDSMEKKTHTPNRIFSFGVFISSLIKSTNDFTIALNNDINNLLKLLYDMFIQHKSDEAKMLDYFQALTITLCCLYDENSVFYDELNILKTLLGSKMELNENTISFRVCLTCVAYKANLIENEKLSDLYAELQRYESHKDLLAFYARFLLAYGFNESLKWIEECSNKWLKAVQYNEKSLQLENEINGLLSVVTGDSIHTTNILNDKAITFKSDLEKLIKPELIMRSILNTIKKDFPIEQKNSLNLNFALVYSTCSIFSSDNSYSIPSSYDYLDDYSILKEVTNTLIKIASQSFSSDTEKRFSLLVNAIKIGCETSSIKTLPPINWFYLMSSLIKSQFGKANETSLFSLTLMHLEKLSSALGFFRNFLISLNTFNQFKDETQHLILKNLDLISKKLDPQLLLIIINKIKIYLNLLPSNNKDSIFGSLLQGFHKCFQELKSIHPTSQKQLQEFFESIFNNHLIHYKPSNNVLDNVVNCLIELNDDNFTDKLLVPEIDDFMCFQIKSFIKFELVSKGNQCIIFINDIIEILILKIDLINEDKQNEFLQMINKFVFQAYRNDKESKVDHIDDRFTNWLVEFMNLLKNIATNTEDYSIESVNFACLILATIVNTINLVHNEVDDRYKVNMSTQVILEEFKSSFKNLIKNEKWNNISIKMIDLISTLCYLKRVSIKYEQHFEKFLNSIQQSIKFPSNIWYRYMLIIENKI